ncbi:MAG TPA: ATP-binding protein [Planctomycetota bacterium]|nr:ATP-binding protein [Planctomycetota bacterium]
MTAGGALFCRSHAPGALRRAGLASLLLAVLAPLLAAIAPPQAPVEQRLEEAWRWRILDGPDGAETVFRLVRPGTDGGLLALDAKGLLAFDGWTWRREPGWDDRKVVDAEVRDIAPLDGGVLLLTGNDAMTVDAHGTVGSIGQYSTGAFVSPICRNADGSADLALNGEIVRAELQRKVPLASSPEGAGNALSMTRDASGTLWCASEKGVFRQVEDSWVPMSAGILRQNVRVWYPHALSAGRSVLFLPERIDDITPGLIWDGSELVQLRPDKGAMAITDAAATPDGAFIIAASDRLLVRRDGRWREAHVPLASHEILVKMCVTGSGQLATVFASGRMAICDLASREWESFDTEAAGVSPKVNVITPSAAGGYWIGTDTGIVHFDGETFGEPKRDANDWPLTEVTGLCEDAEGALWVSSGSGFKGVWRLQDGHWTRYKGSDDFGDYFFVHSIRRCGDEMWFTEVGDQLDAERAQFGGLVRWKNGKFTRFMENEDGTSMPRAYDVLLSRDGSLLSGLADSVRRFDGVTWHPDGGAPMGRLRAFALHESRDGTLWVGFDLDHTGIAVRRDGKWLRLIDGPWQRAAAASFAETPDGRLWFASKKGFFLVLDDECRDVSSRLPARSFWPVLADGGDGLWLGTLGQGLLHFRPHDTEPPKVRKLDAYFGEEGEVIAKWDAVDRWNATPPEELSFRVLVDGNPASSSAVLDGQQMTFPELPSGPHDLKVTAIDSLGNMSMEPAAYRVTVPPPGWRSLPVLLAAGAIVAVLLWLLVVIRNRRSERTVAAAAQREMNERLSSLTLRLLSTQEDERRSISREMHDDLGQLLTAACLDIERATRLTDAERRREALGSALRAARDTQQRVREISHMLRPTELDDHGLPQAVATILLDFTTRSGIDVESNIQVEARGLPSDVANHVFRILQEALTNILRHARAATAFVTLQATHAGIELKVSDDGVGFDEHTIPPTRRYGLLGMRERAELLGGKFSIRSKPEGGTEVSVSIPIPHR